MLSQSISHTVLNSQSHEVFLKITVDVQALRLLSDVLSADHDSAVLYLKVGRLKINILQNRVDYSP